MQKLIQALSTLRPPAVMDEDELQLAVAQRLEECAIPFVREARIGPGCRADFLLEGGVVIEIKAKPRPYSVLMRQLRRYAACESVTSLLLVINAPAHLPAYVGGKPLAVLNTKSLWGVAL